MRKYKKYTLGILSGFLVFQLWVNPVYASEGEEYITISVDATDDNENLMYALDTDDPSAFSSSNEFVIPAGTIHTIYVKDAAGNITSQEYVPAVASPEILAEYPDNQEYTYVTEEESGFPEDGITIDIDVDNLPDSLEGTQTEPAEPGQGTVYEKVNTDTSQDAERIFYTVTTDEGEVFYLVIDQGQSSNNVYLLDQVNLSDLKALAVDDTGAIAEEENSDSLLSALGGVNTESNDLPAESTPSKKSNSSNMIILIIILAIGGGVYYYMKVYKNKKDEQMDIMDAMDKDDFVASDDEEEDDLDFGLDENYQEEALERLLEDETEDESAGDEEIYATSHKNMDDENNLTDDNDIPMEYEETEENFDEEDFDPELDGEEE